MLTSKNTKLFDHVAIIDMMHPKKASLKQPCFIILSGLDVGRVFKIDDSMTLIGRHLKCNLILRDDCISRRHAKVKIEEQNKLHIEDLGSTNGIFFKGNKITSALLENGEKVLLGRRTLLKFAFLDELELICFQQMHKSSTRDALTGILNRSYFSHKISVDLAYTKRHKIPLNILMMDIDHFKQINDTYGHQTGDRVLMSVTSLTTNILRADDLFARYGGEEFIIMTKGTNIEGAHALGERIRQKIEKTIMESIDEPAGKFHVTISIGVAAVPPGVQVNHKAIIAAADKNLYEAKESGRNKVISSEIR